MINLDLHRTAHPQQKIYIDEMEFIPVNSPDLSGNERKYLIECIESGWISSEGPFVKKFEDAYAKFVGRTYAIAVSNGTAAIDIAISSLGIQEGDEVIVPAFTIISCINQILRVGATPIFVDADQNTWNMNVDLVESLITTKTKAIMVVHTYGLPVDMDPISSLARKYGLHIIEDAAEAHGLTYRHKLCGSFGTISTMSFYANKHLTTGEGGMITTDSMELAQRCRSLRNLCFQPEARFIHEEIGWNYRMTSMQAALGLAQLERTSEILATKKKMGHSYNLAFRNSELFQLPIESTDYAENNYWVYGLVSKCPSRLSGLQARKLLEVNGVGTRPFFYPLCDQPVLKRYGIDSEGLCPVARNLYENGFYLPSGTALTEAQIQQIIGKVLNVFH